MCIVKDKQVVMGENWKKVKNNLEICIKFVIKIYEPFDSVNSTPRNLTQINHHYRYKDKIIIMFEILSKEAKKKKRKDLIV